jgi:O-antigen/teichoic acid export membrane protein
LQAASRNTDIESIRLAVGAATALAAIMQPSPIVTPGSTVTRVSQPLMTDATQVGNPSISGPPVKRSSRILANAGFRAMADVGSKIATATLYILVARKLGSSELGIYAFALSFVGLLTAFGSFGQDIVLIREVSRDRERLRKYYAGAMTSRAIFSLPPLAVALLIASLTGMNPHTMVVIALLGIGFTGDYLVQVPFAVFQAYERMGFVTTILIAQRWCTTAIAVLALYLHAGLVAVVAIYCVGSLLAAALGTSVMYRHIARPRFRVSLRGAFSVTREALPIGIALVTFTVLSRIDMTMLAIFKPASRVGQYGAAYKLLETTAFVAWAVNAAVLPSFSRLSATSTPPVGDVYQRALKLVLAITVPVTIGAAILAGPIIALIYGSQYHEASTALLLLAPTIALFPLSSVSCQLFYGQGRGRIVGMVYAVAIVENVVVNLILIPRFSLFGAAAGTSISELLVASTLITLSRGLHGKLDVRRILSGTVLASAVAAAILALLPSTLWVVIPPAMAAYVILLLAYERFAFPDDFAVFHNFVAQLRSRTVSPAGPAPAGSGDLR